METTKADGLSELLERVEKATGPDREMDARICAAIDFREDWMKGDTTPLMWRSNGHVSMGKNGPGYRTPEITASLDAALALVNEKLPGCQWTVEPGLCWIRVLTANDVDEFQGASACTPIAVLSALLRTLIAERS